MFISKWQQNKKKVKKNIFSLMARPSPPSPLNGPAIKKITIFCGLPYNPLCTLQEGATITSFIFNPQWMFKKVQKLQVLSLIYNECLKKVQQLQVQFIVHYVD